MALDLTPEQRETGKANFHRAVGGLAQDPPAADPSAPEAGRGVTRRSFMKGLLATGAVLPLSAAAYFGYRDLHGGRPVRTGLIGTGDEGGVLIGEHNPEFMEFIACSDIRPSNRRRIFEGDPPRPGAPLWRKGFNRIYGSSADRRIRVYERYQDLLANPEVEAVVIALPLHLHAQATIDALRAGKHVLCEKLMAWNIAQCKEMIRVADQTDRLLSIGHQRHYSLLYAQANELLAADLLGDVRHIRALWHRNNALPRLDANGRPIRDREGRLVLRDSWRPDIKPEDRSALANRLGEFGYRSMEELVRWRLYQRTGGGLMAELGSHQLDACSIFLGKKHPLAVTGVGGKYFYEDDREVEDHVFCTFEFPGKTYDRTRRPNDLVVVTYSSVSTNNFEKYGECVMGSKGTLVVEEETNAMLWPSAGRSTTVAVTQTAAGQPALDTSSTSGPEVGAAQAVGARSIERVSRGYREEMEHLAWIIRMRDQGMARDREDMRPRCHGRAAMADAIIALAANQAMRGQQRVVFDERWFDASSPELPAWDPQVNGTPERG
jgi:predicted dehydrogenase